MFALIIDGVVWELFPEKPVLHPSLDVRDVSAVTGIEAGWLVDGEEYSPPPASTPASKGDA
jgi:hypothetical protein